MKRVVLLVLIIIAVVHGRTNTQENQLMYADTIFVDSVNVSYTKVFWQDKGTYKSVLIEAFDDSSAGFASDSISASIELKQVFNLGPKYFVVMNSRAHPDSTTYPNSTNFMLSDSMYLAKMDTTAKWIRTAIYKTNLLGDTVETNYSDDIATQATTTNRGAYWYQDLAPSYSPGILLKLTGKLQNKCKGPGSRWIIRLFMQEGEPVKQK